GEIGSSTYRLGRAEWACTGKMPEAGAASGSVLSGDGEMVAAFAFEDCLRRDAAAAVSDLKAAGVDVEILSGDRTEAVQSIGDALAISRFGAQVLPGDKTARLVELAAAGHKTLMVGDGLNDAPALAAAHVAMAPATAADIGRNAADFVFLRESL